jgi:hypothetical protein
LFESADRRCRQIHEQKRQVSLRIDRVPFAGTGQVRQVRAVWPPTSTKAPAGASIGPGPLSDPALVAFAAANGLMAEVPEPASMGLLLAGAVATLARRRRRAL